MSLRERLATWFLQRSCSHPEEARVWYGAIADPVANIHIPSVTICSRCGSVLD